ncbi:vWA domain-containing protein [Candidatus Leptofilum sp.]|uniref:vWA domain-containing protein n=1 Tax=Candidatus Leptofilum sp. TaxID=3241576 RepID=UPI003B592262
MMIRENKFFSHKILRLNLLLLFFLLLLAACGGADESVEDSGEADTSTTDDSSDSEAIGDSDIGATGSEEDSGEIPPTPEPGSKVETARSTPDPASSGLIAANPNSPADRIESVETAVTTPLDLVLLVDVTGSMASEIIHLQASLPELTTDLSALSELATLRLGLVTYRDQGKTDTTQLFDFTEDASLFANQIASLTAVGGGDYPEAVASGLDQAVFNLDWRTDSTKLLIIIGDAPPHTQNANALTYEETSQLAAEQNIFIYTIGSDGLDDAGAAIYQQIAQNGNGRFLFVTDNPENTVGEATAVYPTSQLYAVIIEIVQEVLNAQVP